MAKILICEDDKAIRQLLCDLANNLNHVPIPTQSGAEAIMLGAMQKPEIAFIDIGLPGSIDGYEVCRKLRSAEKTKDAYIIILTGRQGNAAVSSAKEAGANAFLRKPFKNSEFAEVVKRGMKAAASKKGSK